MKNRQLWRELENFQPGADQFELFLDKLQRETGWDFEQCLSAIGEYKKFLYLGVVSNKPVTPSLAIDEVWHLHLTFTRDYWTRLCADILAQDFHHDPADAGSAAQTQEQYLATLSLYQQEFADLPPATIWPMAAQGETTAVPAQSAAISKTRRITPLICTAIAMVPFGIAAATNGSSSGVSSIAPLWLLGVAIVGLLVFLIPSMRRHSRKGRTLKHSESDTGAWMMFLPFTGGSKDSDDSDSNGSGSCTGSSCSGGGCGGGGCGGS